jgi:hypothetical protein
MKTSRFASVSKPFGSGSKIWIIGPRGVGKSTLAAQLSRGHAVPVIDLDDFHRWQSSAIKCQELHKMLTLAQGTGWIVTGNDSVFRGQLMLEANQLILLDCTLLQQICRILRRAAVDFLLWRTRPYASGPLSSFYCQMRTLKFISTRGAEVRADLVELRAKFAARNRHALIA